MCLQSAESLAGEQNAAESLLSNIDNFASVFRSLLISNAQQQIKYNDRNFSKLCNNIYMPILLYMYIQRYIHVFYQILLII